MRVAVPLKHATRLLNHGPTTLVSTAHGGRQNAMAAQWVTPLDFDPPLFTAVIAGDTLTRELLDASGQCVIAVPTVGQVSLVDRLGTTSGRDGDKLVGRPNDPSSDGASDAVVTEPASMVTAPLIVGCAAWLECVVVPEPAIQARYDLFVLRCVAAWADDAWWQGGRWEFGESGSLHHQTRGTYFTTGRTVSASR